MPWERLLPGAAGPRRTCSRTRCAGCSDGSLACVQRVEDRLRRQFRRLDAACDHRVIASLAYLRITELLHRDLARRKPRFFRHRKWMAYVITDFSNSYFDAFTDYERGRPVPESLAAVLRHRPQRRRQRAPGPAAVLQRPRPARPAADLRLDGPAHPDGVSRKHDHDGVNEINVRAIPKIKAEIERRYDPTRARRARPAGRDGRARADEVVARDRVAQRGAADLGARRRPRAGRSRARSRATQRRGAG